MGRNLKLPFEKIWTKKTSRLLHEIVEVRCKPKKIKAVLVIKQPTLVKEMESFLSAKHHITEIVLKVSEEADGIRRFLKKDPEKNTDIEDRLKLYNENYN